MTVSWFFLLLVIIGGSQAVFFRSSPTTRLVHVAEILRPTRSRRTPRKARSLVTHLKLNKRNRLTIGSISGWTGERKRRNK